jgi:hypothetical protein
MVGIRLNESTVLNIPLEPPAPIDAFFIFGMHKGGSSLLNAIFYDLCELLQIPSIAMPELAFEQGIPSHIWEPLLVLNHLIGDGYCYRGFRNFPLFMESNSLLSQRKKILLVRDPRDAIVSAYFSFAWSHPAPAQGELSESVESDRKTFQQLNIEQFAKLYTQQLKVNLEQYERVFSNDPLLKVYRYEDIIFNKFEWIKDMLEFLQLSLPEQQILDLANRHHLVPQAEEVGSHIRKVVPGDYLEKLSPDYIHHLNQTLSDILERYGYSK